MDEFPLTPSRRSLNVPMNRVETRAPRNFVRSASLDSAIHRTGIHGTDSRPVASLSGVRTRRNDSLRRRSSGNNSRRSSISISRETGDSILNSIRLSHDLADQILGNVDSSVMAQIIDSGDRVVDEGEIDGTGFDVESVKSVEHKVGPLPDDILRARLSPTAPPFAEDETVSTPRMGPAASSDQTQLVKSSSREDRQYKLPRLLDYCAYLIHLAVFGFFGVFTRYFLEKLFGPSHLALTSDQTPLYLDLPSNMLGSFLMGWFGIVFKADVRHISDHVIVGISTGYMGSLTTFSGWNQKMLQLSSKGHWVYAVAGMILGMFIVNESIAIGVESAERLRRWIVKCSEKNCSEGGRCNLEQWRVNTSFRHSVVTGIMLVLMVSLWVLSAALAAVKVPKLADGAVLWMGCSVAPLGVWTRWYLARLNGEGIGKKKFLKWLPIGTLTANVLAACIMAALAVISKAVDTKRSGTILSGIQLGFLGCLSTVSTFAAEVYTMRQSGRVGRAFAYATATILLSFAFGTLIYSVPVWVKHYK